MKDFFVELFSKFLYMFVQAFFWILYYIEKVFKVLAGIDSLDGTKGTITTSGESNLLTSIITNEVSEKLYLIFMFIGLGFFVIALCIGLIKANISKDSPGESKKVLKNSLKAILFFILLPMLFVFAVQVIGILLGIITEKVNYTISGDNSTLSIAQTLWLKMFECDSQTLGKISSYNCWETSYDQLPVDMKFTSGNFNYIIAILVSAIMFWSLGIATIGLAERLINVMILYLMGPIMIGSSPLDSGTRLNVWKDRVLVKLFGVIGNILSMYLFIYIINIVDTLVQTAENNGGDKTLLFAVYLVVCVGGAMCCCKGQQMIASLISQNAGQEEGLSTLTTSKLAGDGARLAGSALKASAFGAGAMTKAIAQKGLGGSQNPSISQVGANLANGISQVGSSSGAGGTNATALSALGSSSSSGATSKLRNVANSAMKGGLAGRAVGGTIGFGLGLGGLAKSTGSKIGNIGGWKDRSLAKKLNTKEDGSKLKKGDAGYVSTKDAHQIRLANQNEAKQLKQQQKQENLNNAYTKAQEKGFINSNGKDEIKEKNQNNELDNAMNSMYGAYPSDTEKNMREAAKKSILTDANGEYSGLTLSQKVSKAMEEQNNISGEALRSQNYSNELDSAFNQMYGSYPTDKEKSLRERAKEDIFKNKNDEYTGLTTSQRVSKAMAKEVALDKEKEKKQSTNQNNSRGAFTNNQLNNATTPISQAPQNNTVTKDDLNKQVNKAVSEQKNKNSLASKLNNNEKEDKK